MVRTRLILLTLAVVAVGAALAVLSARTLIRTEATTVTVGGGTMVLTATGTGVTCNGDSTKCTVPSGGTFSLKVDLTAYPDAGGYPAFAYDIDWSGTGLTKTPPDCSASADEIVWPDKQGLNSCAPSAPGITDHFQGGDISTGFGATPSEFKGTLVIFTMNCPAGDSTNDVHLVPWDPTTNPLGAMVADPATNLFATSDDITINCGAGGAQATATPTVGVATPTQTATVGGPTNTPETGPTNTPETGPTNTPPAPTNTPPVSPPTATNTPIVQPSPTPISQLGDANGDGMVDSEDAQLVLQYECGLADAGDLDLDAADVNRDGEVNSIDALFILWMDAGLYP